MQSKTTGAEIRRMLNNSLFFIRSRLSGTNPGYVDATQYRKAG
jgi:hypothetical protein